MTPRIKETSPESDLTRFSEILFSQVKQKSFGFDLSGDGTLFTIRHPALIKVQHQFEQTPTDLILRQLSSGQALESYSNLKEAQAKHPETETFSGFPCHIYQLLQKNPQHALIDFGELGAVYISRQSSTPTQPHGHALHHYLLPVWLDYALSAELWGPVGKWTRFHERLHTLFTKYGLLDGEDFPGYYPLKIQADWLGNFGFKGKLNKNSFDLTLQWDFPLSGLVELEKVLARGP